MNIAIIGFGNAGKHYLKILKKWKKNQINNIFIFDKEKIKIKNNKLIKSYLINDLNKNIRLIDYAVISTPSYLHFKYAKVFLENNINVLIEKPAVLSVKHANILKKLSLNKNLKCWVTLQNRYNSAVKKLKLDISKKKVGKVNLVDCTLFWHRDKSYYDINWRGNYKTDGGVLANQAIHLLDALIYIFGKVQKFNVMASFNKKKLKAEDLIFINFHHLNNIFSSFKATTRANKDYRVAMDILGEKGRILVKGISLNTYHFYKKTNFKTDKINSESFHDAHGLNAMGTGHKKILNEFFNYKLSTGSIEIQKNIYLLKLIHSIYNRVNSKNKLLDKVTNTESVWGR